MNFQATQELCYVLKRTNIRDEFDEEYLVWARSIIHYCKDTQIKSTSLQFETKDADDMNDGMSNLLNLDLVLAYGVKCLFIILFY